MKEQTFIGGWADHEYAFAESINHDFSYSVDDDLNYLSKIRELREFGTEWGVNPVHKKFQWIRKPENIALFFQTVKLIGLEHFISRAEYNEVVFDTTYSESEWKGKSLNQLCVMLMASYTQADSTGDYFAKFWARRQAENNGEAVYAVLKEIDAHYNGGQVATTNSPVDTVLYNLLKFDVELKSADSLQKTKTVLQYFDYLRQVGLHHSAYNLAFEVSELDDLELNRDSLLSVLKPDTITEAHYWNTRNNARWIKTYRDNGP